jgi:ribosomal RNA-processing protein 8
MFINKNKRSPAVKDNKFLNNWLSIQNYNYKTKKHSMIDETIYNLWSDFLEEYKEYINVKLEYTKKEKNNYELWYEKFEELKQFINNKGKTPSDGSKYEDEKKIGGWLQTQRSNYKNNSEGMKDETRYKLWTEFLEEYKEYLKSGDEIWYENYEELKQFINTNKKRPNVNLKIGTWLCIQNRNYIKKTEGMKNVTRYNLWSEFLEEYKEYLKNDDEKWYEKFDELKNFINKNKRRPNKWSQNEIEKKIGNWLQTQRSNYKKKLQAMKDETKYNLWTEFTEKYLNNLDTETESNAEEEEYTIIPTPKKSMKLKKPSTKKQESQEQKRERVKSELSILHQRYKTLSSQNLHQEFNRTPDIWHKYHEIAEENEKSFPEDEIPRNRVIQELNKIKTKRTKRVVDMGCGKAQIAQYFATDPRFQFINYDHISSNDTVESCDIANTPLEDDSTEICILSLAMWGSNCRQYIQEASRILESGGKLYIIEPTKRWSEKDENGNMVPEKEGEKLKMLLEENGLKIVDQNIAKFCLFVGIKV